MSSFPRILISAPNSGGGKTTVTCAILQAFVNRNMKISSFKCGPDYIDPMFHAKITGRNCYNIDLFFAKEEVAKSLFCKHSCGADLAIIEGAMGFYDGVGGITTQASAYDVAVVLDTPVILVVNAKGASLSMAAIIKGMVDFRNNSHVCGIILNNCNENSYKMLAEMIENELQIPVLGFLPNMPSCELKSRHLGLVTADEIPNFNAQMQLLAQQAEKTICLEKVLEIANKAADLEYKNISHKNTANNLPRIAVAHDDAFCFYYKDNLELLMELGAEIVEFSPINDSGLPPNIDAIYLGGGYPELYLEALEQNTGMRLSVKQAITGGMPTFAECGGFMYLHENIYDENDNKHRMVGACKGDCNYTKKLGRFGYITLTAQKNNMMCNAGDKITAHEFHYYDSDNCGNSFLAEKPKSRRKWDCIISNDHLFAGFPHLYFYNNIDFAKQFISIASAYKRRKNDTGKCN